MCCKEPDKRINRSLYRLTSANRNVNKIASNTFHASEENSNLTYESAFSNPFYRYQSSSALRTLDIMDQLLTLIISKIEVNVTKISVMNTV